MSSERFADRTLDVAPAVGLVHLDDHLNGDREAGASDSGDLVEVEVERVGDTFHPCATRLVLAVDPLLRAEEVITYVDRALGSLSGHRIVVCPHAERVVQWHVGHGAKPSLLVGCSMLPEQYSCTTLSLHKQSVR